MSVFNDKSRFVLKTPKILEGVSSDVLDRLVELQQVYGAPLTITSGHRNPLLNSKVRGVKNSQHLRGTALDIAIPGASPEDTARLIGLASQNGFTGIGGYRPGKVHIDIGPKRVWGPDTSNTSIPNLPKPMQDALYAHQNGKPYAGLTLNSSSRPSPIMPLPEPTVGPTGNTASAGPISILPSPNAPVITPNAGPVSSTAAPVSSTAAPIAPTVPTGIFGKVQQDFASAIPPNIMSVMKKGFEPTKSNGDSAIEMILGGFMGNKQAAPALQPVQSALPSMEVADASRAQAASQMMMDLMAKKRGRSLMG